MKISIKELRIGNLALFDGRVVVVWGFGRIMFDDGSIDDNVDIIREEDDEDNCITIQSLQPIPLTEKWLVKFGFDDLGAYGYGRGNFHICLHENEFYFPINNRKVFIKYVHQLQNLYFALTGEDLEIKTENK